MKTIEFSGRLVLLTGSVIVTPTKSPQKRPFQDEVLYSVEIDVTTRDELRSRMARSPVGWHSGAGESPWEESELRKLLVTGSRAIRQYPPGHGQRPELCEVIACPNPLKAKRRWLQARGQAWAAPTPCCWQSVARTSSYMM